LFLRVVLPTSTGGGDSEFYRQLAEHPLRPIEGAPNAFFQFRPLVPTIVWALPLPTDLGFHVATMISLVAGALLIASLTRAVGVGWLALAAGPVYVLSFVGFLRPPAVSDDRHSHCGPFGQPLSWRRTRGGPLRLQSSRSLA
jgi:hypothetical protein